jgi:hypothetical protein
VDFKKEIIFGADNLEMVEEIEQKRLKEFSKNSNVVKNSIGDEFLNFDCWRKMVQINDVQIKGFIRNPVL